MKYPEFFPLLRFENQPTELPFVIMEFCWTEENVRLHNEMPHMQDYVELIWITKGTGSMNVDLKEYALAENSVFCITPGQVHQLKVEQDMEGYLFLFTENFLFKNEHEFDPMYHSGFFDTFSKSTNIRIQDDISAEIYEITQKMMKECGNRYPFKAEILRRYFKIFLIYLTRQFPTVLKTTMQSRNIELAEKFKSYLEKNFRKQKKVADYARLLSVTPNYLNEIVKKITGYPASHHIRQRIVLEAKRQAAYSDVCMKEVAWQLGFSDIAHFSKFFKNSTGINFSEFKKECHIMPS
ncbi:helix-turn-helix domain-containing protein [Chitinophaga oryziterrae]|uniref:Helix-turn-helix domain-containing protein n=1 Tax=Chitinophaga oryziterrae TaxID=1031224 RepID=A0A6N8J6U6_9BACT|nr:helix-turn-helix domain-containing protein [Chitinophaga oryziterrae]MVT40351.1 helix-turn-helix domain-containing protein [Chitinophaga oryziterrae]